MYDVTCPPTFESLPRWLSDAQTLSGGPNSLIVVLVGNKVDMKDRRAVSYLEASRFAQEHDLMFLEVSALTGEMVAEAFYKTAQKLLVRLDDG